MRTTQKTILAVAIIAVLMVSLFQFPKTGAPAEDEAIIYVPASASTLEDSAIDVITVREFSLLDAAGLLNIIIDAEMLMDDTVKAQLHKAFSNEARIIVAGNMTKNEVRAYFGQARKANEEKTEAAAQEQPGGSTLSDNLVGAAMIDTSQFKSTGKLIYKEEDTTHVIDITVEDHENQNEVFDAFKYCLKYDYASLESTTRW